MFKLHIAMVTGVLTCPALIRADCIDGMRPATEAERKFHVSTMNALKSLVPPAPAGWSLMDNNRIVEPSTTCVGAEKTPARLRYEVRYYWAEGAKTQQARNAEQSRRIAELRALPPEQQKQSDELSRRSRQLDREAYKARAAGNKAEFDRLTKESRDLAAQSNAIVQTHLQSVNEKIDALSMKSQTGEDPGTEVRLEFAVNWERTELFGETVRPAYTNAPIALRAGKNTVLAFGSCKSSTRTAGKTLATQVRSTFTGTLPATSAQTLVVRASGTANQVDEILKGLDGGNIARLVSR